MADYRPLTEAQYRKLGFAVGDILQVMRDGLVVDYHLLAAALRLSVTATIADLDPAGVSFSRSLTDDLNRTAEIIEAFEEESE